MAVKKSKKKKSTSVKKATPKKQGASKKKAASKKTAAAKGASVTSAQVMLSHVFALRPRVIMAFRPDDFRRARQLLEEEAYESIQKAARAVAERALELTQEGPGGGPRPKRL